jgi:hypothetical protein
LVKKNKRPKKRELSIHYQLILSTLGIEKNEILHKNKVFEILKELGKKKVGTGLTFKQNFTNSMNGLEKMRLVEIKKGKQSKEIIILTSMGIEIADLIIESVIYQWSYTNLIKSMEKKVFCFKDLFTISLFEADPNTTIMKDPYFANHRRQAQHKLEKEGWTKQEIKRYNTYCLDLIDYRDIFDKNYVGIILLKYFNIAKKYQISNKSDIFKIIKNMILQIVERKIDLISDYEDEMRGYRTVKVENQGNRKLMSPQITSDTERYYEELSTIEKNHPIPGLLNKEFADMRIAYTNLLRNCDPKLVFENEGTDRLTTNDIVLYSILETFISKSDKEESA